MSREQINLLCPKCDSYETINRLRGDPLRAVSISMICPDCDDGDFYAPTYYDSAGNEVSFDDVRDYLKETDDDSK